MGLLTRDAILAAPDLPTEEVQVPEWGGVVFVRGLTGAQRDRFEASIVELRGRKRILHLEDIRARLVAMTVVDADGRRLFTDQDVPALSGKSASALQRVFEVAQRLSGLSSTDIEELTKNSENDQSEGSTSD